MSNNESYLEESFDSIEISLSRSIRFWLLLITDIPSVICSFILLIHLIGDRAARHALNNHVIILLILFGLGTQLIDVSFYLAFIINSGIVKPSVPAICIIWWFIAFALYNGEQMLLAWAAIERHIFIFNDRWTLTRRGRFLYHYLPLILILLYLFIFYIYVFFIFQCENTYAYDLPVCNASPCYQNNPIIGIWEFVMNNILPGLTVAFVSIGLLIRVIRQKQRLTQQIHWRKYRRLTLQLLLISLLNIIFILPLNLLSLAHLCGLSDEYGANTQQYFYFLSYFFAFLIPFVCLGSTPDLVKKIKFKSSKYERIKVAMINISRTNQTWR